MIIEGNYFVKKTAEDDLVPEDTLADSQSQHSSIERPISRSIFTFIYICYFACLIFLAYKAGQLQISRGARLAAIVEQRSQSSIVFPAIRGIIYDKNGKRIVDNVPILDILIQSSEFFKSDIDKSALIAQMAVQLAIPEADLKNIVERGQALSSFVIKSDVSKEEAIKIQNLNWPGVYVVPDVRRHYVYGPAMAQLSGYMSTVTSDEIQGDDYYLPSDRTGKSGLEAQYENTLRGNHYRAPLSKESWTALGEPEAGKDIHLTIDAEMQSKLYSVLEAVLRSAGLNKGAAIVQDVRTGEILAMTSAPSFDPNLFEASAGGDNNKKLMEILNNKSQPLFNRVIGGRYSPGSTIKPLYALAGLQEKVITPSTTIYSAGSISVQSETDPTTSYIYRDWKVHGATNLRKAIADSVDVYFYAIGGGYGDIKGLGIDRMAAYLKKMWADQPLNIDLPGEKSGTVPDRAWKLANKKESWYIGDTYNMSIGQGDLVVTPLWLNVYTSAIANDGKIMRPYLVSTIQNNDAIIEQVQPNQLATAPFDLHNIRTVQDAMRSTVTDGTARLLADLPVPVAAKTGTAQITNNETNSLITVWGPIGDPTIAMTVVIENTMGKYGLVHQVAHDFLSWYFGSHVANQ